MAILEPVLGPVLEPCWGGLAQASRLAEQGRVGAMQAGLGGGGGAVRGCSRAETEPNRGAAARPRLDWRRRGPGRVRAQPALAGQHHPLGVVLCELDAAPEAFPLARTARSPVVGVGCPRSREQAPPVSEPLDVVLLAQPR